MAPLGPGRPSRPFRPFLPLTGFFATIFCTLGASRLNVMAPFAMFAVWMRPVASAVPPATAMNAVSAQAAVTLVRMLVEPFW